MKFIMKEQENNIGVKPEVEEKKPLTLQQLQKRKKMVIFPLFFLLFALSMWFIFAPSGEKSEEIISAEIDPKATRNKSFNEFNDIFSDRQPDLYWQD